MQKNDKKIIKLKEKIKTLKKEIVLKFEPKTNCILKFKGHPYNLHVMDMQQCYLLLLELNALRMSEIDLPLSTEFKIGNYTLNECIDDLKSRLSMLTNKNKIAQLKIAENKLNEMLSSETKVELELSEIEKMLM